MQARMHRECVQLDSHWMKRLLFNSANNQSENSLDALISKLEEENANVRILAKKF